MRQRANTVSSSWYPAHYGYASHAIKNACQVPRSFYNFLRYHNVCPEYDEQLVEALKICDTAEKELPKVHAAGLALPGDFNKSASAIFGGAHAGLFAGDKSWVEDMKKEGIQVDQIGIRNEEARLKFAAGVAFMGSDEQVAWLDSQHLETLEHVSVGLEVIGIQLPTENVRALYREQTKISEHKIGGQLEPLGKLICETWDAEDCDEWDLPKDKYPGGKPLRPKTSRQYEFWVEESILEGCFVGLKIDAKVLTLEGGITILDEVHETMCSFFTFLPNELWMERKPREVRWLPKGLPDDEAEDVTVPEVEEGQKEAEEETKDKIMGENQGEEPGEDQGENDDFDDEFAE